jgi:protection-of-telomeres protein 1
VIAGHPSIAPLSFNKLFDPSVYERISDQYNYKLKFIPRLFRAAVRVVDYFPHDIQDFAVGREESDFEMLSDYSGDESDQGESKRVSSKIQPDKRVWEWRFSLQFEDCSSIKSDPKPRIWAIIDNRSAQFLLNMDASK